MGVRNLRIAVFMSGLVVLFSFFPAVFAQTSSSETTTSDVIAPPPSLNPYLRADVEAKVRSYFADIPVMIMIAKCESNFRQFTDAGNVLHGGLGGEMIGVFQFHEGSHITRALALGYNLDTLEGNLAYARYLYNQAGTDPWISSFGCWGNRVQPTGTQPAVGNDLRFGMETSEVLLLQQKLNRAGFTLATSGPGSPGNETIKFGNLTRAAVRRFQCTQSIVCSGDEYTTGYGLVGVRTREVLETLLKNPSQSPVVIQATAATDKSAEIARLQAQIAELIKLVAALQAQLAAANN